MFIIKEVLDELEEIVVSVLKEVVPSITIGEINYKEIKAKNIYITLHNEEGEENDRNNQS